MGVVFDLLLADLVIFGAQDKVTAPFSTTAIPLAIIIPDRLLLRHVVDHIQLACYSHRRSEPRRTCLGDSGLCRERMVGISKSSPCRLTLEYIVEESSMRGESGHCEVAPSMAE